MKIKRASDLSKKFVSINRNSPATFDLGDNQEEHCQLSLYKSVGHNVVVALGPGNNRSDVDWWRYLCVIFTVETYPTLPFSSIHTRIFRKFKLMVLHKGDFQAERNSCQILKTVAISKQITNYSALAHHFSLPKTTDLKRQCYN